jgi:hypothetical protein
MDMELAVATATLRSSGTAATGFWSSLIRSRLITARMDLGILQSKVGATRMSYEDRRPETWSSL